MAIVSKSFPQYLQYSRPFVAAGHEKLVETLESIVADQNVLAERIGQMLLDADAPPRSGEFPMDYTDMHDLDIDFLVSAAINYQQQDINAISEIVGQLQLAPAAKALAEESLGMAKGHFDSLQELLTDPAAAS